MQKVFRSKHDFFFSVKNLFFLQHNDFLIFFDFGQNIYFSRLMQKVFRSKHDFFFSVTFFFFKNFSKNFDFSQNTVFLGQNTISRSKQDFWEKNIFFFSKISTSVKTRYFSVKTRILGQNKIFG